MAAAGVASIELAKANGSWESLDAVEAFVMPDDLATALAAVPGAAEKFATFAPSARKAYLHWISQAVQPETRAKRIREVAGHAAAGRKTRHDSLAPANGAKRASPASRAKSTKPAKSTRSAKSTKPAKRARQTKSTGRTKRT
jgi:hypothetical protein